MCGSPKGTLIIEVHILPSNFFHVKNANTSPLVHHVRGKHLGKKNIAVFKAEVKIAVSVAEV